MYLEPLQNDLSEVVATSMPMKSRIFFSLKRLTIFEPGCIVLWLASVDHTLHSRLNGWVWPRLWRIWRCLLEFTREGHIVMGYLANNGGIGLISCIQIHQEGKTSACKATV